MRRQLDENMGAAQRERTGHRTEIDRLNRLLTEKDESMSTLEKGGRSLKEQVKLIEHEKESASDAARRERADYRARVNEETEAKNEVEKDLLQTKLSLQDVQAEAEESTKQLDAIKQNMHVLSQREVALQHDVDQHKVSGRGSGCGVIGLKCGCVRVPKQVERCRKQRAELVAKCVVVLFAELSA